MNNTPLAISEADDSAVEAQVDDIRAAALIIPLATDKGGSRLLLNRQQRRGIGCIGTGYADAGELRARDRRRRRHRQHAVDKAHVVVAGRGKRASGDGIAAR